jgi:hypothetical protein
MSQQCKLCKTENEDSAKFCTECSTDLNPALICDKCKTKNPIEANYCSNCRTRLFIPDELKLLRIKLKNKLTVSDSIKFKRIDHVIMDLFDIRTKDGSKFKRGYFNYGNCIFDKSKNEKVWFPQLGENENRNLKNELLDDGETFKEYIAEQNQNENENLLRYNIFAKFKDNSYHFIGKFKKDRTIGCEESKSGSYEIFYKKVSEVVFLKEKREDVIPSEKRRHQVHLQGLAFGNNSSKDSTPKRSS